MSKDKDSKAKNYRGLTIKQEKFLVLYPEKLNVYRTAEAVGISKANIIRDIQKDTAFGIEVRRLTQELDDDPRFSKAGTLSALYDMEEDIAKDEELEAKDRYRLILDIRKEINKMIDGNIASQKKIVEKKVIEVKGGYDFTKLPETSFQKTIDISHEEV
jgi:hypothetical protein